MFNGTYIHMRWSREEFYIPFPCYYQDRTIGFTAAVNLYSCLFILSPLGAAKPALHTLLCHQTSTTTANDAMGGPVAQSQSPTKKFTAPPERQVSSHQASIFSCDLPLSYHHTNLPSLILYLLKHLHTAIQNHRRPPPPVTMGRDASPEGSLPSSKTTTALFNSLSTRRARTAGTLLQKMGDFTPKAGSAGSSRRRSAAAAAAPQDDDDDDLRDGIYGDNLGVGVGNAREKARELGKEQEALRSSMFGRRRQKEEEQRRMREGSSEDEEGRGGVGRAKKRKEKESLKRAREAGDGDDEDPPPAAEQVDADGAGDEEAGLGLPSSAAQEDVDGEGVPNVSGEQRATTEQQERKKLRKKNKRKRQKQRKEAE